MISEENDTASEEDYRRALELLNHVEDPTDVKHKIWCSVILRDNWTTYNINAPLNDLQNMLLFKLIDLCFVLGNFFFFFLSISICNTLMELFILGSNIDDFLPPIKDFLEAPELASLTPLKSFQFLLKLAYEHINESYMQKVME